MKSLALAFKQSKKLIFCIAAAYILCVIVCAIHISDVSKDNAESVKEAVEGDISLAVRMTQSIYSDVADYVKTCADKVASAGEIDINTLSSILASADSSNYFKKTLYIHGGHAYGEDGIDNSEQAKLIMQTILADGEMMKRNYFIDSQDAAGQYDLLIPVKVTDARGDEGIFVAVYDISEQFKLSTYTAVQENVQLYMIGGDGIILADSKNDSFKDKKLTSSNFFTRLLTMVDGSNSSKTLVQELRASIYKKEKHEAVLNSKLLGTDEIYVDTISIRDADELAFICMYDFKSLAASKNKTVTRTWFVLGIILLATLAANIFIWNYLRNVTSRIEKMAYVDDVTKGRNLNYFRNEAMNIVKQYSEMPYLIQRFDISNFRYLNEAYGHIRADEILKACVDIYDEIYSDREVCVRMSSDQFVTLTINDTDVDKKRDHYEAKINEFARSKGIRYPIRLKFGIYQIRKTDTDIDVIVDRANVARKSLARSKTEFLAVYSDNIVQNMRKTEAIEADKEKALQTGEFKVFIQAKWDIINDCVAGGEALVRWIKADGNMVFPDEFIPVFEENGFIEKVDFYMLESVCKRMAEVKEAGGTIYPISVNQSRVLLNNPDYIEKVKSIFEKYDVPREFVELEVTETSLADNKEHMIGVLNDLKNEKVRLDMDDFGSGYSSLNLLKDMPFDVLKIDREFFSESITSSSSTLILQKIVEMASGLGIEVICEGVENQQQVDLLKEIGCKRVQGYFYAKPVPMEDYIKKYCKVG
ncbi:MAG: EAL domain-containing protein [Lachnospiraceae bacterium]|nr:EAL domain-containing protein [Candidatus Merdinaster equi]